jgi:anti-sigma B factor antagonist
MLPDEVDLSNASSIEAQLDAVFAEGARSLFVDMSETTFCDCSGVNALVRVQSRAQARGVEFYLEAADPSVRRVFELTGADLSMDLHESLLSALTWPAGPPAVPEVASPVATPFEPGAPPQPSPPMPRPRRPLRA